MRKTPIIIVLIILAISTLFHLIRQIMNLPLIVGPIVVPPWTAGVDFGIAVVLLTWSLFAIYTSDSKKT